MDSSESLDRKSITATRPAPRPFSPASEHLRAPEIVDVHDAQYDPGRTDHHEARDFQFLHPGERCRCQFSAGDRLRAPGHAIAGHKFEWSG